MIQETDFAGRQIVGARKTQEDDYCFCPLTAEEDGIDGLLLVVADGMGGHAGGSLASRLVVEAFVDQFCGTRGEISARLLSSLQASERRVHEEIVRREKYLSEMGSTLVGVVWTAGRLYWVSVGDSGLYLYRNRQVTRLNADHSMAPVLAAKAARGEISAREAAEDPDRNLLRSAIAADPPELYELRDLPFELRAGDIILTATDGLGTLDPKTLSIELQKNAAHSAEEIAIALLTAVYAADDPKQDNATVAVIRNPVTSSQQT
jgi:serine/threonine protein phosphatase PrpC